MRTFIFCLAAAVAVSGLPINSAFAANGNDNKAQQIAGELKQSGRLKDYRVGVRFEDGVAWLTGTVTDQRQRQIAEEVALRSPGVSHVVNKLEVENFDAGFEGNPEVYDDQNLEVASNEQFYAPRQQMAPRRQAAPRQRQQAARAPRSNMPVPYASAAQQQRQPQQAVRPVGYSRQAGYCPDGSCMTGGGGAMGGGMPPAASSGASYDNPQMPGYAWPSYAANQNYAALTYPKQYSPSAWPYIGPFYPYPQVPLGWRKVSLEWDDGWWFLDFKDK